MTIPLALYIHIPFCAARCAYCDFNTYAGLERFHAPFVAALITEIRRAGAARGRPPARTIFIGGGTPTVLAPDLLAQVLQACREAFDVAADAEITCEANPGTVDQQRFADLHVMGVNRLSLGVQSFDDEDLRWLGRIHSTNEAEEAFRAARTAGFANINLDFIFGLPGQHRDTWLRTLERAIALGPEHLSLYSLTVEQGTPLYDRVRRGLVPAADDDLAAALYELACDRLARAGYEQYEISNWAKGRMTNHESRITNHESRITNSLFAIRPFAIRHSPFAHSPFAHSPFACRHNLVYWRREPYLGFGPGAHSFDRDTGRRWWNVKPVPQYIQRIEAGRSPEADGEIIDRRTAMAETMMLGLRLVREGVADASFRDQFGVELNEVFGAEIRRLTTIGWLERLPDRVRLSPAGRLLGNRVFAEFMP